MKELEGLFDWLNSFSRPEKGCDSLIEWLEVERKAAWARSSRLVGSLFFGAFFAVAGVFASVYYLFPIGIASPHHDLTAYLTAFGIGAGIIASGALLCRLLFWNRPRSIQSVRDAEALREISHLREITAYKGLKRELGEHGMMELNEGAQLFMRCRSVLSSPAWCVESPDNPWTEARNDLMRAMEASMDRLTLFVVKKRPFSEIGPVLDEMRTAANEIRRITDQRLATAGAGRDLRTSLARMQELAAAEDELLRIRG